MFALDEVCLRTIDGWTLVARGGRVPRLNGLPQEGPLGIGSVGHHPLGGKRLSRGR